MFFFSRLISISIDVNQLEQISIAIKLQMMRKKKGKKTFSEKH